MWKTSCRIGPNSYRSQFVLVLVTLGLLSAGVLSAQERAGELRLGVSDPSGAGLQVECEVRSEANHLALKFETDLAGKYTIKELPFGNYKITVQRPGFALFQELVEIRSEIPATVLVSLKVASEKEAITVKDSETLLNSTETGTSYTLGKRALENWESTTPGRSVIEAVKAQPGWLVEANGVLHPRGFEYGTQYVVDGIPVLENRSPAFAPGESIDDIQSVKIYTSGIPAEFGRKLGGVVESISNRNPGRGFHGMAVLNGESFATTTGYVGGSYFDGHNVLGLSSDGASTGRYLDPPVQQNFTNKATTSDFRGSFERDMTERDRVRFVVSHDQIGFLVPNEQVQEAAGQRQHRDSEETAGQFSYQHIFSSSLLASFQGRVRDLSAGLESNTQSTPIAAFQDRGFRDGYVGGSLDAQVGRHELKVGADAIYTSIHENFSYQITSSSAQFTFDPSTPGSFSFAGTGLDREQAFYGQDQIRLGNLSLSAGLRFDHYSLRVDESAWSPRLGISWYLPKAGLILRGSYDRIFSTPAIENILLSTSPEVRTLNQTVSQLPVQPSRGNYYEVGVAKGISQNAKWSVNYYRRDIHNFGDDDTLLNTGISFPITLRSASIYGIESQVSLASWGPFSGWVNYSYMVAEAQFPVVGGLFLGDDVKSLQSQSRVWASQDQRHTVQGQIRYQPVSKFWTALAASYGSGLPVELNGEDAATLANEFGQAVVNRVNLDSQRVRPASSMDVSAGVELWKKELRSAQLQGDIRNLTNRLNVINFASLFSGTALASPRTYSLRVRFTF
jgi:TonB dependent receptor